MRLWGLGKKKNELLALDLECKRRERLKNNLKQLDYGNSDTALDNMERLAEAKQRYFLLKQELGPHVT